MRTTFLPGVMLCLFASTAFAVEVHIPNGSFDNAPLPSGGYGQTISQWLVGGPNPGGGGDAPPDNGLIPNAPNGARPISGVFSTFSAYTAQNGTSFGMINNMGTGTVSLQSTTPFLINDRRLQFQFVYVTQHTTVADTFRVQIEFFTDATLTTPTVGSPIVVDATPTRSLANAGVGAAPFGGSTTFTDNATVTSWGLLSIDIEQFLGSYGRVTFFVDDSGIVPGGGNLGITGVLLDDIVLTPEPSTLALFGLGLLGLGGAVRRRRRRASTA